MVESLDMTLGFHVESLVHCSALHEHGHRAVKHIYLLLGIGHHASRSPDARHGYDHAPGEKHAADNRHQLDFVF